MPNVGPAELILILAIALIVFGPKKLPEIGRGIGSALREFNKARNDLMDSLHTEMDRDEPHRPAALEETASVTSYEEQRTAPDGTAHHLDYPVDHGAALETASADALPYGSDFHSVEGDSQPSFRTAHAEPAPVGSAASSTAHEGAQTGAHAGAHAGEGKA